MYTTNNTTPIHTANNTISETNKMKLQRVQNQAIRFVYNERYLYTGNTITVHEGEGIEPLNYNLYKQADKTLIKVASLISPQFTTLIDNYERNQNIHGLRRKKILDRGLPGKTYSNGNHNGK